MVPFAGLVQWFVGSGCENFVESRRLTIGADSSVRVAFVIQQLVFMPRRTGSFLNHKILDAVVSLWLNVPFPGKLVINIFFLRDDVPASLSSTFGGI